MHLCKTFINVLNKKATLYERNLKWDVSSSLDAVACEVLSDKIHSLYF